MIILLGLVIPWSGCSSPGKEPAPAQPTAETRISAETPKTPTPEEVPGIPDWFLNPPKDPNYLYATGTAKSKDIQDATLDATNVARLEIVNQIQTKVSGLFKRFREEVGAGEDADLLPLTQSISKSVASELLTMSTPAKKDVKKEGIHYRAYVMMEMPIGETNTALVTKIKANRVMYTRFRASQAFKELEEEVEKYEQSKKE
jgi:hypothetical protein